MGQDESSVALNRLFNAIGGERFLADVSINGEYEGAHDGRIILTDANSHGRLELLSLDSDEFHTSFDAKYQNFSFSEEEDRMVITGNGRKNTMSGQYEVVLKNIIKA